MSNLNTKSAIAAARRSYCSVIITRATDACDPIVSVGRPIRDMSAYVGRMTDEMGGWGFAGCSIVSDFLPKEDLPGVLDGLRAKGLRIEGEEAQDNRPRAEKFSALLGAMRSCGLKVTIRNADVDGETKRLTINGDEAARASFMEKCSDDQAAWVKRTFVAVADRAELRYGVVSVVDA
jgi:hypothetical protein